MRKLFILLIFVFTGCISARHLVIEPLQIWEGLTKEITKNQLGPPDHVVQSSNGIEIWYYNWTILRDTVTKEVYQVYSEYNTSKTSITFHNGEVISFTQIK